MWWHFISFVRKPWRDQVLSLGSRWVRWVPHVPFPVRLPYGGWWLARNDSCGVAILGNRFETAESRFARDLLRPGMTFVDIGAHHGYYTLLASRRVGCSGRVMSFEPSPRERRFLRQHLRLNRCRNVLVFDAALGRQAGTGQLFVVEGRGTGCNSLMPPNVPEEFRPVPVEVRTLDECLRQAAVGSVDLVKLDVEGAELEVLHGASALLQREPRPVLLCEVEEIRTRPWGYAAHDILAFLERHGFAWFRPLADGRLAPLGENTSTVNGNFVAVPAERLPPATASSSGSGNARDALAFGGEE